MKKRKWSSLLAGALTAVMLFTGCAPAPKPQTGEPDTRPGVIPPAVNLDGPVPGGADRQTLSGIVEVLGGSTQDLDRLDDQQLQQMTEELLEELEQDRQEPEQPGTEGTFEEPFDQVYPELVEKEEVAYDEQALLLKLKSGELTTGMEQAGAAALEKLFGTPDWAWYKAKLAAGTDAEAALNALRQLPEVLEAEYDYEAKTAETGEYQELPPELAGNPRAGEQWYLNRYGIASGMAQQKLPGGDPSVVVAVIDTGVDYTHEDLAQNIWVNTAETPDDGIDNDENGYVDDYYGVNILTGQGSGMDDNGHGTHVAGIIAAQNNNLGTVGIAYNVKIMPIKAAMASGYLHQSDVAKAVIYAYQHGAEVINMSFGSVACSLAVQDALEAAYTRCVLVASAGNEGLPNEWCDPWPPMPNFPAALPYVLGVMSVNSQGVESAFSNWDVLPFNGREYELYAPGEAMVSTIPGNRYASWSGTSMAAPVVSAMAAILRSEFSDRDAYPTKFIYGQLSATSDTHPVGLAGRPGHTLSPIVDLQWALTQLPRPDVGLQEYSFFDTQGLEQDALGRNDGSGVADAGETLALGLTLRNRWGMSRDTVVTVDALSDAGIADPYIEFLNPEISYGSVGTYSTQDCGRIYTGEMLTGWERPFYVRIRPDCPNDYVARIRVQITCKNGLDDQDTAPYRSSGEILLRVRSGQVLPSVIREDMTLTPDKLYIIPNQTRIEKGATVTVEAGTRLQFWSDDPRDPYRDRYMAELDVQGQLIVSGTPDDMVQIFPSSLMDEYRVYIHGDIQARNISLRYAEIVNLDCHSVFEATGCVFRNAHSSGLRYRELSGGQVEDRYTTQRIDISTMEDCVFYRLGSANREATIYGNAERCLFADSAVDLPSSCTDCVFLGNTFENQTEHVPNASVSTAPGLRWFSQDAIQIFYDPRTGTTYASLYYGSWSNCVWGAYFRLLGGDACRIETEQELDFLRENLPDCRADNDNYGNNYGFGIRQARDGSYLWENGSPVPDFVMECFGGKRWHKPKGSTMQTDYREVFEIPGPIQVTQLQLMDREVVMDPDSPAYPIVFTTLPGQVPAGELIFESRDPAVAEADAQGRILPKGLGSTEIDVYSGDRAVYTHLTVTVREKKPLQSLQLTRTEPVAVGTTVDLGCSLLPADTTRTQVTYQVSDPDLGTVDGLGRFTAWKPGTVTVTVSSQELGEDGNPITASFEIRTYRRAESLKLERMVLSGSVAQGTAALPEVLAENADVDLHWSCSDPQVAAVMEGKLILRAPGTAVLTVRDAYSGQEASCVLLVHEQAASPVRQVQMEGQSWGILLENGDLYYWYYGSTVPALAGTGIRAFAPIPDGVLVAMEDNRIEYRNMESVRDGVWTWSVTDSWEPLAEQVTDLGIGDSHYFARTASGQVYNWLKDAGEPQLVMLENVTDMQVNLEYAWYLTGDGRVFCSQGPDHNPVLRAENIRRISRVKYGQMAAESRDGQWWKLSPDRDPELIRQLPELEQISLGDSYQGIGIRDGRVYRFSYDANTPMKRIPGIVDAVRVDAYDGVYYVIGADGTVYVWGSNANGSLGGVTTEDKLNAPAILPLVPWQMSPVAVTGQNLTPEGVLTEEQLLLQMNQPLTSAAPKVYLGQVQQVVQMRIDQMGRICISRESGFTPGAEYRVEFPAGSLKPLGGKPSQEPITLTFTYQKDAGNQPEKPQPIPSQQDEALLAARFRWTPQNLFRKLNELREAYAMAPNFVGNAILNRVSTDTEVEHWLRFSTEGSGEGYMGGNYWGTVNPRLIEKQLVDGRTFSNLKIVHYAPFLTEAPENTFPFVTGITVLNKAGEPVTTVGNEEITVHITFNRDMDTAIPLSVVFGSAYPFGDYRIEGAYTNPRTWEGKYTLGTLIENGEQYFTVSNGCAAGETLKLYPDRARFRFRIDTTAAQALIMQGQATDTGVELSWTQDDFDTLMGYNVYRSDREDGDYRKLNATVIPAEEKRFFDDTVEPGKVYYYNFTVVKTDMTESRPSGKISIMSKDTMAPDIYHTPVYQAETGRNLVISASITDNLNIAYADLYYRTAGETQWKQARMNHLNSSYSAIIPAGELHPEGLEYYIAASDGVTVTRKGSETEPYTVTVRESLPDSALGDVNGDGVISAVDAMLLLYHINDKANLTHEQFLRADLNRDGVLWAAEALRILQYANGTVGSVTMQVTQ